MPGEHVRAEPEGLRALASQLREGVSGLGGVTNAAPPAPNAGVSSARVGEALAAILRSSAGLVASLEDAANKIDASDGSYGEVDNKAAADFGSLGGG